MSVTQYEIPCAYDLLKLKDTVFFLSKNNLKTITIDNGEAYAAFVNPSPQPPSPNRLKGFNVKLTETESLDERYKFTKQLTMSIHGHLTDSRFLMDDDYYIVVQSEDGTYYLVNVDFPSKMTYTYNLSNGQNQTDFTFTSNSNHPTLKLNWNPVTWNICQTYQVFGIDGLKLLEKDYTTIDGEQGVINLFDGHEFKDVDFLKNTISLQEAYDGDIITTTISFEIPFNNYKPSWQYNLLEFDKNLYAAHITPKNSNSGIFCGYEHGLQPSYEINGSTSDGESTTIKITLAEASNWGVFEFDTWSYHRDSSKRWVGIDSEVKCIGLGVGINTLMQEVDGNGTPTQRYKCLEGYESEYTNYNIVGTYTESDVESFRTSVCTRFKTRSNGVTSFYTCIDGDKYALVADQASYDGGKAWVDGGVYSLGELIERGSSDCEAEPQYEWRLTDEWGCAEQLVRWIPSGTTCINGNKYRNNYKQVSDDRVTWYTPTPVVWSASTVIEYHSEDCGYRTRTVSGTPYCTGTDLYVTVSAQTSTDYGSTWRTTSTSVTLVEADSAECEYHPEPPSGTYKFYGIRSNGITRVLDYSKEAGTTEDLYASSNRYVYMSPSDYNEYGYLGDYVENVYRQGASSYSNSFKYFQMNELLNSFAASFSKSPMYKLETSKHLRAINFSTQNCPNLRSVVLNDELESIDFYGNSSPKLKQIVIPKNVSIINTFLNYFEGFEEVFFESKIPPQAHKSGQYRISNTATTIFHVPQESVNLYKQEWNEIFVYDTTQGHVDKLNLIQGYSSTADTMTYSDSFKYKVTSGGTTITEPLGDSYAYIEINSANVSSIVIGDSVKSVNINLNYGGTINLGSLTLGKNVKRLYIYGSSTSTKTASILRVTLPNGIISYSVPNYVEIANKPTSLVSESGGYCVNYTTNSPIASGGTSAQTATIGNSTRILGGFVEAPLTSVTIGNSVGILSEMAFYGTSLTTITLPSSLEVILPIVLCDCPNLQTIRVEAVNPPEVYTQTQLRCETCNNSTKLFQGCDNLRYIYVPSSSVEAYKAAYGWSYHASKIVGY